MINKDTDNKLPIYKLTSKDQVLKYYDDWTKNAQFNQDMIDFEGLHEAVEGLSRALVSKYDTVDGKILILLISFSYGFWQFLYFPICSTFSYMFHHFSIFSICMYFL